MSRVRWLLVLLPAVVVGGIELLSDTLLDRALPFPLDTLVVVASALVVAVVLGRVGFRRIDALTATLATRNRELEERAASATALHRVSVAIAALSDLRPILDTVVRNAQELLAADVAFLLLSEPDGRLTRVAAAGAVDRLRRERSGSGNGISRGGPNGDPSEGEDLLAFLPEDLAASRLAAPLQRGDETIGLLAVASAARRAFDVGDVETLASLANQAAIAIENARLQSRLRELAVAAERERIAREMHDGLAQVLGYVNTKSQAAEELLATGRVADARVQLSELAAAARSIYVDVREAILGLRSPIEPGQGLVAAIERYARSFADASKLAVTVEATPGVRGSSFGPDVEAQVYRIVQESLTNVRKHASARRVAIRLADPDDALVVELADDGTGIAPGRNGDDWPRYGMDAMRERASGIGASVEWREAPGGGALVRLTVPHGAIQPAAIA